VHNFGQLPSIVLPSGQVISQTGAIARYIARIAGFMPKTNEEIADCDQIFELAHEMNVINPITVFYPADSVEMAHGLKEFMLKLPHWLRGASKVLGNKQFFGGQDGPHYGDFHLLHVFLHVKSHNATFLDGHDTLKAWFERMCNLEKLQKYFQEQPR
jgi:glutathione S-transferase